MSYNPNIPQPGDNLDISQGDLLTNFTACDVSFGIEHYKFSNLTANNGKHNTVTSPAYVAFPLATPSATPPVTAANEPKFYGFQDSANVGVIQYSRGPSNAVPTPLTSLQSTSAAIVLAPGTTTNVLDFTGLSRAFCQLFAADLGGTNQIFSNTIWWTGSAFLFLPLGTTIVAQSSGNILQIKNNTAGAMSNIYWTLKLNRLS